MPLVRIELRKGKAPGIRPEDVFIKLVDAGRENWSVDKGEAQYAS